MGMPYKVETRDGRRVRVYESGAVLDDESGKIIKPPDKVLITEENSIAYHRRKLEKKAAIVQEAANMAVEDGRFHAMGDLAFIGAIAYSAMIKATTPDDPKSIEAARFLLSESGFSSAGTDPGTENGSPGVPARVVVLLAELSRRRSTDSDSDPVVIDGSVSGPDSV